MSNRAVGCVAYGQICFALFVGVCVALHPGLVLKGNEGGMSNYGTHLKTVIPFTLALGLASFLSQRAAVLLTGTAPGTRGLARLLRTYSELTLLVLVSSYAYSLDTVLRDVHVASGIAIALFELAASLWMYRLLGRTGRDSILIAVQLVGFTLAALTVLGALHVLFVTQVLTGGSFAVLLVRSGEQVVAAPAAP
jgi:hypothetical protein